MPRIHRDPLVPTPPLKWAGGKRWLIKTLQPYWDGYTDRRLIEPFVGGLSVALGLRPQQALLNDTNPHLINFYRWLKQGPKTKRELKYDKQIYYQHRDLFNEFVVTGKSDTDDAAELFYYLNRTCFNGLCRFNRQGKFNVPFGRYNGIRYKEDFTSYAEALENWEFRTGDFSNIVPSPNDFIYADPPYHIAFTNYSPGGFTWDDQVRLAKWLAQHPGPVVASNHATEPIIKLYTDLGFSIQQIPAPRMISRDGNRTPVMEMLAVRGLELTGQRTIDKEAS